METKADERVLKSERKWRAARAAYSRRLQAQGMTQDNAALAALARYPLHLGVWTPIEDGPYTGTASERETIVDRVRAIYGPDGQCQFSAHGAGRYSVQIFRGNVLLADVDL